jgi:predicted  nucleic acid-binding Zn-ribbon protein
MDGEEVGMKADPTVQENLLDLPVLDQRLAQLAKERTASPLRADVTQTTAATVRAEEDLVDARTRLRDLEREVARAEQDVETVRSRITRDQQTLDAGTVSPKQLQDLQHELESLARRQAELEDVELELMERTEEVGASLAAAQEAMDRSRQQAQEAAAAWDRRSDEIAAETVDLEARRADVVAALPEDLVALYERIRERSGQGAALLRQGRCGACQLMLSSTDLDRVRAAAPDDVVRCEECGAIMVRTDESGL